MKGPVRVVFRPAEADVTPRTPTTKTSAESESASMMSGSGHGFTAIWIDTVFVLGGAIGPCVEMTVAIVCVELVTRRIH